MNNRVIVKLVFLGILGSVVSLSAFANGTVWDLMKDEFQRTSTVTQASNPEDIKGILIRSLPVSWEGTSHFHMVFGVDRPNFVMPPHIINPPFRGTGTLSSEGLDRFTHVNYPSFSARFNGLIGKSRLLKPYEVSPQFDTMMRQFKELDRITYPNEYTKPKPETDFNPANHLTIGVDIDRETGEVLASFKGNISVGKTLEDAIGKAIASEIEAARAQFCKLAEQDLLRVVWDMANDDPSYPSILPLIHRLLGESSDVFRIKGDDPNYCPFLPALANLAKQVEKTKEYNPSIAPARTMKAAVEANFGNSAFLDKNAVQPVASEQ